MRYCGPGEMKSPLPYEQTLRNIEQLPCKRAYFLQKEQVLQEMEARQTVQKVSEEIIHTYPLRVYIRKNRF